MTDEQKRIEMLEFKKHFLAEKSDSFDHYETGVVHNCEIHGEFNEKGYKIGDRVIRLSHCTKCVAEKAEREAKELAELKGRQERQRLAEMQKRAGVSPRNECVRFKHFEKDTRDKELVYNAVYKMAMDVFEGKKTQNIIMTGKVGTGKTMLANCAINALFKSKSVRVIKLQDMLRKIKASYSKDAGYSEQEAIDTFSSYDLLILDEVGVSRDTDNDKNLIFDVMDGRYQNLLPTMIISNMNIDGIKETLGDRVVDRLRDGGGVLLGCDWESYRK